jgi:hypothetical protein
MFAALHGESISYAVLVGFPTRAPEARDHALGDLALRQHAARLGFLAAALPGEQGASYDTAHRQQCRHHE